LTGFVAAKNFSASSFRQLTSPEPLLHVGYAASFPLNHQISLLFPDTAPERLGRFFGNEFSPNAHTIQLGSAEEA
jgi:hypothetical protein